MSNHKELVGRVIRWTHGPNTLVGPATHYDPDDDELFIAPDGLMHGHYWVPASECVVFEETQAPSEDEREALARAVFIASEDFALADRMAKAWDAPGAYGRARWYRYADAILARFDVTPKAIDCPPECRHECGECRLGLGVHRTCDPRCEATDSPDGSKESV